MNVFKKLNQMIMTKATWKKAFLWFLASQIVYLVMLYVTIPSVEKNANQMKIFDLMPFGYSVEYATILLEQLGEQGRETYLKIQIPLDLIYPSLMGVAGVLFMALLSHNVSRRIGILIVLPILAALFDYLENVMIAVMLFVFPTILNNVIVLSSIFTVLKSGLTTLYCSVLLVLFFIFLYKMFRRNVHSDTNM